MIQRNWHHHFFIQLFCIITFRKKQIFQTFLDEFNGNYSSLVTNVLLRLISCAPQMDGVSEASKCMPNIEQNKFINRNENPLRVHSGTSQWLNQISFFSFRHAFSTIQNYMIEANSLFCWFLSVSMGELYVVHHVWRSI